MVWFLICALVGLSPAWGQARFAPPFFFGLAAAPGQSEDQLPDIWMDWAAQGRVAAFQNQAQPERRLDFWTHPEVELDLAARSGIQVYRFGVDWGRVMPRRGVFDPKAIERYREILRLARARKMKVMLTLMHHSVPKWVQERGGWLDGRAPEDFAAFCRKMIDEFHPDVDYWITFNEPNVFAPLAYAYGFWPPGQRRSGLSLLALGPWRGQAVLAMDRMADAHNDIYAWAHAKYPAIKIGIAHNMELYTGKSLLGRLAGWYVERLMDWRFPERIRGRMDFFGINYYGAEWLRGLRLDIDTEEEYSEAGRAVYPKGLYILLKQIGRRFPGLPIIVTENGISDATDLLRPAYLIEHLMAVAQARQEGVPVAGYIWWTLSDNMEWADGYCPKFGLVAVDRGQGLKRAPRPSYGLFRQIVTTREVTATMREKAWAQVTAHAGQARPFCRAADGATALSEPGRRRIVPKDWRFQP